MQHHLNRYKPHFQQPISAHSPPSPACLGALLALTFKPEIYRTLTEWEIRIVHFILHSCCWGSKELEGNWLVVMLFGEDKMCSK